MGDSEGAFARLDGVATGHAVRLTGPPDQVISEASYDSKYHLSMVSANLEAPARSVTQFAHSHPAILQI